MSAFGALFDNAVLNGKDGKTVESSALDGTAVVGVYFSAHWCPPCRGFTPKLSQWYTGAKNAGLDLEIVFASSDRDQASFQSYHDTMSFLALPFQSSAIAKLSRKFQVQGIPTLVLLDGQGNVVTKDGRSVVVSDPKYADFPYTPPTLAEALGNEFVKGGTTISAADLKDKTIGLYFSAHWCPPCRQFTPQLCATYKKLQEAGKDFELIFVSSDRDQAGFDEYHGSMNFAALPFADRKRKEQLSKMFEVSGIPSLVIVESIESGVVINPAARGAVGSDPEGKEFPWKPKSLNDIESEQEGINEHFSLIALLGDADEATATKSIAALDAVANVEGATENNRFFYARQEAEMVKRVRSLVKATGSKPVLVFLDIPQTRYVVEDLTEALTPESINAKLAAYKAGEMDTVSLR